MSLTISKEHTFSMAHRLYPYDGKCGNIHGHTYKVIFTFIGTSNEYPKDMLIDFTDIKKIFCHWIDKNWDHKIMLSFKDPIFELLNVQIPESIFGTHFNPTVENMCHILKAKINSLIKTNNLNIAIQKLTIYETDTSSATIGE